MKINVWRPFNKKIAPSVYCHIEGRKLLRKYYSNVRRWAGLGAVKYHGKEMVVTAAMIAAVFPGFKEFKRAPKCAMPEVRRLLGLD